MRVEVMTYTDNEDGVSHKFMPALRGFKWLWDGHQYLDKRTFDWPDTKNQKRFADFHMHIEFHPEFKLHS